MKKLIALYIFLASCAPVPEAYQAADKATYEAVAPEYEAYFLKDDRLSAEQKERRKKTLLSWEARAFKQDTSGSSE